MWNVSFTSAKFIITININSLAGSSEGKAKGWQPLFFLKRL